jgi:predicted phosphodiesterase
MIMIGDVHGKIDQYRQLIQNVDYSIQVGDMGVGFVDVPIMQPQHRFLRGNHDNPDLCRQHPNYLGEWGYLPLPKLFYVSGAYSIDRDMRIAGINWWADEELSQEELGKALTEYALVKPEIVISHDCPVSLIQTMLRNIVTYPIGSRTGHTLQAMLDVHRPDAWIFGHHHVNVIQKIKNTEFVCLAELGTYIIPDLMF